MKLVIIGAGLIGRSVALAAQRADPTTQIVEIDRGESIEAAREADVVVLATPVDVILDIVRRHADVLRTSITIDTGSTKQAIVAAAREAGLDRFIGGHPMAGAATSGPAGARADLFDGRLWFLVPHGAAAVAVDRAQTFVRRLGASVLVMDDDGAEHDRTMAAVSHLPQVVASVLMTVVGEAAGPRLEWSGGGLRDSTRLAESSATIWQSVLATNASALRPLLYALADQLHEIADELNSASRIQELFAKANRYRALL